MTKTNVGILKEFFDNPPLSTGELKNLSADERKELAAQAAEALGYKPGPDNNWIK